MNNEPITTTTTTTTTTVDIPNCTLYTGQDRHGNHIQALVPFTQTWQAVFAALPEWEEWNGDRPVSVGTVYAATLRRLIAK